MFPARHSFGVGVMLTSAAFITAGILIAGFLMNNRGTAPLASSALFFSLVLPVVLFMIIAMLVAWVVMSYILGAVRR